MTNLVFTIVCCLIGLPFMLWIVWQIVSALGQAIMSGSEAAAERRADQRVDIRGRYLAADQRLRLEAEATRAAMRRVAQKNSGDAQRRLPSAPPGP